MKQNMSEHIVFRPEFIEATKSLLGTQMSWGVGVLLDQLVQLTATQCDLHAYRKESISGVEEAQEGWLRVSCRDMARVLASSKSAVSEWLIKLEGVGLVVRRRAEQGGPDHWRVDSRRLFAALEDVGCIPEWSTVFGYREET